MNDDLALIATTAPGHGMRRFWALEADMHFLNHGSYGATPKHVQAAADDWRRRLERQPVRFMTSELPAALRAAAARLAAFLGTRGERLGFVDNATTAVNAVLRSLRWRSGDEIVIANHAYPAVRHSARCVAERHGLELKEAVIPFPLASEESIVDAYGAAISKRTRLVIVDHVFSPLALVAPVAAIVACCKRRGVSVLVDGAHAPGMLPLALDGLGADWYTGNCHKWLLAPKGCAFLHASPAAAAELHPAVISNFFGAGFPAEFDWQGTRDYSAWLAVTAALDFLAGLGVERYQASLRALAAAAARLLSEAWQQPLPAPAESFAAMVTVPLPTRMAATDENAKRWHERLWTAHRVEVPVLAFNDRLWVRISAQVYNELSDYQALAAAIESVW